MYELNVHSICMSIILFDIVIKYFWKTWKKSGKIMEFQNENLVATLTSSFKVIPKSRWSQDEQNDPATF